MFGRRVVITGLAAITPLGLDFQSTWEALVAGKSGIGPITQFDAAEFETRIAGEVKGFDPEAFMPAKQARRMDRFCQFAVAAGLMVLKHSGFVINEENAARVGSHMGVGLGGLQTIEIFHAKLMEAGPNRVSPFMIPMLISNMAPGQVAIFTGAKGPNIVTTTACASGAHAIGYAFTDIALGRCDASLCGGAEATITAMGLSGFTSMKAVTSSHNDDPEKASRPFDKNRDGFVAGEGAGLLMLESLDSAKARGATIYAEIVGFGASCDAFHITAPAENGTGMAQAMRAAIHEAGIKPEEVDHINAHATSTPLNDLCETQAIKTVFGDHAKSIAISATKSMTGHLLGAAGGIEGVFSVMALHTGMVPGTINYETPDPECDLDYTVKGSRRVNPRYALSNSFGFGGTNCSLLFKKWEG